MFDRLHAASPFVVHILRSGYPLCGFSSDQPHRWSFTQKWVGADEAEKATCRTCIERLHDLDEEEVLET